MIVGNSSPYRFGCFLYLFDESILIDRKERSILNNHRSVNENVFYVAPGRTVDQILHRVSAGHIIDCLHIYYRNVG